MWKPIKGGAVETVQGYDCHVPPPPEDKSEIFNYSLPKKDQRWRRRGLPSFYDERRLEEEYIQDQEKAMVEEGSLKQVTHFDPVLEKFRRTQWLHRIYGIHIMINGKLYYLTGPHWYYLEWCKLDVGYPDYFDSQRKRFYFRELCRTDPFCHGYLIIGARGFGKTTEEIAMILEDITRPPHQRIASIQSKNEKEAKNTIFGEKMVNTFNSLPDFFKPEYNHGSKPETSMQFFRDTTRGKKARAIKYGDDLELRNSIYPRESTESALDSTTMSNVLNDEVGKTDPKKVADVHKRLEVNVKTVYRNNKKVGLCRLTTTVEEMLEGGAQCEAIWDESNPEKEARDANGFTVSKIYRYFVSALETMTQFDDGYGLVDEKKSYIWLMNQRKPIKDNPRKLASVMRKEPITVEEAFINDADKCMFHVFIITERIKQIRAMDKHPGRVGRLIYKNGEKDTEVVFVDDPTGSFIVYHMPEKSEGLKDNARGRKILNALEQKRMPSGKMEWVPVNDDLYGSGCDPIKAVRTDDPRASKLAAFGFRRFDPLVDVDDENEIKNWKSHSVMWRYMARHDDPDVDYENMIKAVRFFGHSLMPENNVTDLTKHFKNRGYRQCLIVRKDFDQSVFEKNPQSRASQDEPVTSTPEAINAYIRRIQSYVTRHGLRIPDLELLKQLKDFDPKKPTAYDLVIAFGYTLLSLDRKSVHKEDINPLENPFTLYDASGSRSVDLSDIPGVNYEEEYDQYADKLLGLISQ